MLYPNKNFLLAFLISSACYFALAFYIDRNETSILLGSIFILFVVYFLLLKGAKNANFNVLFLFGIIFRLVFIFSTPHLSDDFYRFIWDGNLLSNGINPYLFNPSEIVKSGLIENTSANQNLFAHLNSPTYYSVYPPMMQFIFFMGSKFSFGNPLVSIVIMRLFILIAEFGSFIYLNKILVELKLNSLKIFLYWLNPLVIIELSGNLHFEAIMIFFVVLTFYYLLKNKLTSSALFLGLAVSTKMIPLVLLPLIINAVGIKKGLIYSAIVFAVTGIVFLGFFNWQILHNLGSSIGLYFQTFEFNASIYYLLRWAGFQFYSYNLIGLLGKILPVISFAFILFISFKKKYSIDNLEILFSGSLAILFVYYLTALVVHPWYICLLLLFCIFTNGTYILFWSALAFLTYTTYSTLPYQENMLFVFLEYAIIISIYYLNTKGVLLQQKYT